jgi:hypothetical protein
MTTHTMEKEVQHNAAALNHKMPALIKKHAGSYALFNNGELYIVASLDEAITQGKKLFGAKTGFVARHIMHGTPVLSALVVL